MTKSILTPLLTSSILASFLLVGCQSSVNNGSDNTSDDGLISGQLVDSYIQNADYTCEDGSTGITDINGSFECTTLPVKFRLGGLELGEITSLASDKQVFPQDLVGVDRAETNNTAVVEMARFLQSCDDDNNSENGIYISSTIKENLKDVEETFNETNIDTYAVSAKITLMDRNRTTSHLQETTQFAQMVGKTTGLPEDVMAAIKTPKYDIDQNITNTLSFMGNEERLAYDVYNKLYETYTLKQLTNIATKSEIKHIQTVQLLVQKYVTSYEDFTNIDMPELSYKDTNVTDMEAGTYDIQEIQDLYDALILKGEKSEQDALEVGCMVEVTDVDDLDKYIQLAEDANATDIVTAFNFLRTASYSHYWAFDKGLKNKGITDGCCALIDEVDYCHDEYPQTEQGGEGMGMH